MKKIVLVIASVLVGAATSFAQCIPDASITVPGNYPDSLPHAVIGLPYATTIQIKVLTDTTYLGFLATIDSIDVTNVLGLPPGFSYTCTPASGHFPGGSNACIYLQGPALPSAGNYPLTVLLMIYGHAPIIGAASLPDTISSYRIVADQNIGIATLSANKFDVAQNIPNPFNGNTEISFSTPNSEFVTLKVSNLLGKVVYSKTIYAQHGLNKVSLSSKDFDSGIYIYTISNSKSAVTKRMIVSNE